MIYTLCFLCTAALVFSAFYLNGKTFVWDSDGVTQHFNALLYYRFWLRDILRTLFVEHRLEIPLWDLKIGYGSDILTTLHYYAYGDPLNLLSVFVPKEAWMDEFYSFLILLRIYLAGLSFSFFCFQRQEKKMAVLMGALLYAFSFWTIFAAVRHPYFMNPMIYFPLVLAGADRIFRKKRPFLYIFSLAAAVMSNFYFGYMICLLVMLYCIFRYKAVFGTFRLKQLAGWVGRFLGYSVIALLLSSVILLPVALCALQSGRISADHWIPLLYPLSYYKKFIAAFLSGEAGYWSEMGYTAYGVLGVFLLFLQKKEKYSAEDRFLSDDSVYASALCRICVERVCLCVQSVCVGLRHGCRLYFCAHLAGSCGTYGAAEKGNGAARDRIWRDLSSGGEGRTEARLSALVLLFVLILWLLTIGMEWMRQKKSTVFQWCALFGLVLCLVSQALFKYAPSQGNYVGEFTENNGALLNLTAYSPSTAAVETGDDSFWRYDQYGTETWQYHNANLALGLNSVTYYWSLADSYIFQFQKEMYLNLQRDFLYQNLDSRSFLDALTGVKYFVVAAGGEGYVPYGFTEHTVSQWVGKDAETARQEEAEGRGYFRQSSAA